MDLSSRPTCRLCSTAPSRALSSLSSFSPASKSSIIILAPIVMQGVFGLWGEEAVVWMNRGSIVSCAQVTVHLLRQILVYKWQIFLLQWKIFVHKWQIFLHKWKILLNTWLSSVHLLRQIFLGNFGVSIGLTPSWLESQRSKQASFESQKAPPFSHTCTFGSSVSLLNNGQEWKIISEGHKLYNQFVCMKSLFRS